MKRLALITFIFLKSSMSFAQDAKLVKLDQLLQIIESPSDEIKVVNFWATWCAPCIKELPLLEKINEAREDVKVILVSMDLDLDPNPQKVYKFIDRKKIQSDVLILDERDPNSWINKIEKQWSGALPATIVINTKTGQRKFIEKELHEGELEKVITEIQ